MRILWIVNTIFPYPAEKLGINKTCFGGWLNALAEKVSQNEKIKLAIATVCNGNDIKEFNDGKITYYLIPGSLSTNYDKKTEKYWEIVNKKFNPELVHIHGTEYPHGLSFKVACPSVKIITSIQGLVSAYSKVYYANIEEKEIKRTITFRDIIRHDNIFQQKKKFEKKGIYEIELIKNSNAVLGRTFWDYSNTKAINNNEKYYINNETLRKGFYNKKWNIENIERHSIFTSQANYPIKGLHYLLETLYILKNIYPDVKLYIAGNNILDKSTLNKKLKLTGYAKYLLNLIKEYKLENQVSFTGLLDEESMVERYLKSNVFVLPSAIENSSNSLCEAMLLGMPCVASNTGGTLDMIEHKKEGFVYPYTEPAMCAEYISKFFEDTRLCSEYGDNAQKRATIRHNPEGNFNQLIKIYEKILEE